jgi:K+-transporting ATPase A subunit
LKPVSRSKLLRRGNPNHFNSDLPSFPGNYMARVYMGQPSILDTAIKPVEQLIYKGQAYPVCNSSQQDFGSMLDRYFYSNAWQWAYLYF